MYFSVLTLSSIGSSLKYIVCYLKIHRNFQINSKYIAYTHKTHAIVRILSISSSALKCEGEKCNLGGRNASVK